MSVTNKGITTIETMKNRINSSVTMSEEAKRELIDIIEGKRIAPLTSDTMAKRIFSPDLHPERFDFIVRHVMNDIDLSSMGSVTDEFPVESMSAKKTISDITAKLSDGRFADLEIQSLAQEFIYNRSDVYSSRMLMFQYSAYSDQLKSEISFANTPGVILVILMRNSPKEFREFKSNRYIHRIKRAVSDSGMSFRMLRQVAFVQLDKALELLISKTYNEDEDVELLKLCAMMADVNNEEIVNLYESDTFLAQIREEAFRFSLNKEVQPMLIDEEMAIWDETVGKAMERNMYRSEGRTEGSRSKMLSVIKNMLLRNQSDEDIMAIAECTQEQIDSVRATL